MTNQQFHQKVFKKEYRPYDRRAGNFGKNFIRKNEKIKVKEVRVIDSDGQQLGVMQTFEAIAVAKKQHLDLVEISPNASPPVCKILDFGKYKYCESKKNKGVPKQASAKTKEVKLRVAIDANDYNTKMRRAIEFLEHGNKLKLSLMFRGREMSHTELGFELVKKFANEIKSYGTLDLEPKLFGKMISVTLSPCAKKQAKAPPFQSSQSSAISKILDASELLKLK
ncbi:MAG: translation initiation factor IF-3 [Puniceicoccales bacterium]|jgi:translation initiation factor IF-3|nr:translation initiation factor IF-3 [Puniceicoccales bacterium]